MLSEQKMTSDEDTDREGESSRPPKKIKRAHAPQQFLKVYQEQWPCLRQSKLLNHAFCTLCNYDIDVSHQGASDCRRHVEGKKHLKIVAATDSTPKINAFFLKSQDLRPIRAETLFTTFIVEHNLPLAAADHAGPLFRKMFPDSEIAKQYSCARTKTASIVKVLAKNDDERITEAMKRSPYSLATDGSTDMEDVKMYPIVVRIFDPSLGRVVVMLLKICESRESTGKAIFELLDGELKKRDIPWSNCVSFAADNAAVMQGLGKGVAAFLKAQHPHIYLVGCACHLIHLAAERASRQLSVNIEDFLVTIYYYLDKSSKRKSCLRDIQIMCDAEVRKILKLSSTRWLSLGQCMARLLQQWDPLTVFFKKEVDAGKKKKTEPSKSTKPLSGLRHLSKASPSTSISATKLAQPKLPPSDSKLAQPKLPPSDSKLAQPKLPPSALKLAQPKLQPSALKLAQPKLPPSALKLAQPKLPPSDSKLAQPKLPPSALKLAQPKLQPSALKLAQPKLPPSALKLAQPKLPPSDSKLAQPKLPPSDSKLAQPKLPPSDSKLAQPKLPPSDSKLTQPKLPPSAFKLAQHKLLPSAFKLAKQKLLPSDSKLHSPLYDSTQKPEVIPLTILPEDKAPAAEFDLSRFLFMQNKIGMAAVEEKMKPERTKKEEKRDLTKPEKILQFLTDPISKSPGFKSTMSQNEFPGEKKGKIQDRSDDLSPTAATGLRDFYE
ncbi:uncharacterized protein LOC130417080 [Triplophysa dalaica]|uniref:uncharacterized protein LOC130417080 n=1 Tax=Triplophysa dalaica TaxID=1582913 RepID=UPI0024DFC1BE|nr:uncharacterized protein LOC130417080 [Triplophysa dalaica]